MAKGLYRRLPVQKRAPAMCRTKQWSRWNMEREQSETFCSPAILLEGLPLFILMEEGTRQILREMARGVVFFFLNVILHGKGSKAA